MYGTVARMRLKAGAEEQLKAAAKIAKDAPEVAAALAEVRRRRGENKEAADGAH